MRGIEDILFFIKADELIARTEKHLQQEERAKICAEQRLVEVRERMANEKRAKEKFAELKSDRYRLEEALQLYLMSRLSSQKVIRKLQKRIETIKGMTWEDCL